MAIENAGTLDSTAVTKTMENLEGEHPWGRFAMGGLKTFGIKRQIVEPIWMATVKNGVQVSLGYVTPPLP
jgi:hypothetical protein